ncbi:MAG: hypothetical protein J6A52_07350 [Bacilli bacterium]|nr:hypothetical protein [Bacilli bacterium]
MLDFKTIELLEPNTEILDIIKNYTYKIKKGKIKHLPKTNLQFIEPTQYIIKYPITLTILEYKVNEISNKPFYIKEHNEKYSLKEIKQILTSPHKHF